MFFCLKTLPIGHESVFQYKILLMSKNHEIGPSSVSNIGIAFANLKLVGKVPDDNNKLVINQGRSHCTSQRAMLPPTPPPPIHFSSQTKKGPIVSVSKIKNIAFYGGSEIIRTRKFTIFVAYATSFGQFTVAFHFFNYIAEIGQFTLNLLKRSDTYCRTF